MALISHLSPERILPDFAADDTTAAITKLVAHLVESGNLDPSLAPSTIAALLLREEESSTGIGGGVAIPHCFVEGIEQTQAVFARSVGGVDFCATDCSPVHFIFLFVVPKDQHRTHLKTLASVAKILNSAGVRTRLSEAETAREILDVLDQRAKVA